MSRLEIPDTMYDGLFADAVTEAFNRDPLHDLFLARETARQIMESTYIRRSTALQCEFEADRDEYNEEMSIGGRPYRTR